MATYNLAKKYSTKVDEKYTRESLAGYVTNNDYDWKGVDTVNVYNIPVVDMTDYQRSGSNRYGTPDELGNSTQELTVRQDRSWTFTIDKLNKDQSMMVEDAGKAISRQLALKAIPEYDTYVFWAIAAAACAYTDGNSVAHYDVSTSVTASNAYSQFLKAREVVGNCNVPDVGQICLCSFGYASLLKQDKAFMRECDVAQNMQIKGQFGEVDGVKFVRVPSNRLPSGCSFILTHPIACVAPRQLNEYKIHTDAPGISGWLCEGRMAFDAFVLNNKRDAIYYCGTSSVSADRYARTTDTSAEVGKTYYKRSGITTYASQVPSSNPAAEHLYEKLS